jgi:hypothetical protein
MLGFREVCPALAIKKREKREIQIQFISKSNDKKAEIHNSNS